MFEQKVISKHLATHLAKMQKDDASKQTIPFVHITVYFNEMFLHLLVRGDLKLKSIDKYLRDIWLECCGHLSDFYEKKGIINMKSTVLNVFQPKVKIAYDYDFGSTTSLDLKSNNVYNLALDEKILLLSRNEPLKLICAKCNKKPAVKICIVCNYNDYSFFCEECSEKHAKICEDFDDYASLPVVNSPRMGTCAYEGGTIDIERDGIYKGEI
jgi:hypothetical protein